MVKDEIKAIAVSICAPLSLVAKTPLAERGEVITTISARRDGMCMMDLRGVRDVELPDTDASRVWRTGPSKALKGIAREELPTVS
jgi:hypothetical protein